MSEKRNCPCEGQTLDRLLQPTVMALLAAGPEHGYALAERLKDTPLMKGVRPDRTGVYRLLASLEEMGLVRHQATDSGLGPSKRVYLLTTSGRGCLAKWIETLDSYHQGIAELVQLMRNTASGT
jgi:DNA-binding PadR family transcriptional regulator